MKASGRAPLTTKGVAVTPPEPVDVPAPRTSNWSCREPAPLERPPTMSERWTLPASVAPPESRAADQCSTRGNPRNDPEPVVVPEATIRPTVQVSLAISCPAGNFNWSETATYRGVERFAK